MTKPELTLTTERIDDFVLLLAVMQRLDRPVILDRYLPRHGLQQGLSWGWLGTIWLAHSLSEGDHRKLTVRDWVRQAHTVLERVTGLDIRDTDFTAGRLTLLLRQLSKPEAWHAIAAALSQNSVRVYDLKPERVRLAATPVSGYHAGSEAGLFQFGHSKDAPTLRQIKVRLGALAPLGMPLVTDVVAGQRADAPLYIPVIDRVVQTLHVTGLLFVGDCKLSALATRAHIQRGRHPYCVRCRSRVPTRNCWQRGCKRPWKMKRPGRRYTGPPLSRDAVDSVANAHFGVAGLIARHLHRAGDELNEVRTVYANGQMNGLKCPNT